MVEKFNHRELSRTLDFSKKLQDKPLAHMLNALRILVDETDRQNHEILSLKIELDQMRVGIQQANNGIGDAHGRVQDVEDRIGRLEEDMDD